jgi:hypothetical protein
MSRPTIIMHKYTGGKEGGGGGGGGGGWGGGRGVGRGSRAPPSYYHPGQAARELEQKFLKKTMRIFMLSLELELSRSYCQLTQP